VYEVDEPSTIAVLGLGYVGCVTAACFAAVGHRVIGVDRDEKKVRSVMEGQAPFFEPGLEELVRSNVQAGRLTATTSLADAIIDADVAFVCVGTPSEKNGDLGLEQLRRVCGEIAPLISDRTKRIIVAIRSTVFPGTCEDVVMPALGKTSWTTVVSNPEFLREGTAVRDFMEPSLLVIGGTDVAAVEFVAKLYGPLNIQPCRVALRTAEMIKYACNTFHALKIAFANEVGTLSAALGVSGAEVMATLCKDEKLNVSAAYLKPGFAFGGSCLPKDLRAIVYRGRRLDLNLPLLESVLPSNDEHLGRAIQQVLDSPAKRIGIFGLTFKADTDDLRESPAITLIEQLLGKGREVRVFDPQIQLDRIYGSNRNFLFAALPHIGKEIEPSLNTLLGWSDLIVVTQKPAAELTAAIAASGLPVIDLSGSPIPASTRPQMVPASV
jgi:GDP-mannose 6-dehydrogenase